MTISEDKSGRLPQLDGVIVLNKPSGPTSAGCLNALKRLGQKKIGHGGTLDPMACGVLLALLGQATKISGPLLEGGLKIYRGEMELGMVTDTWDRTGRLLDRPDWRGVDAGRVGEEIARWKDLGEQMVPPYSAAKHGGRPLYSLARRGQATPVRVKHVNISRSEALEISLPLVRFRVTCGSGTYVRSLAHSLGMRLGCGAVLTQLTREYSHPFGLGEAISPEQLGNDPALLAASVRPIADALPDWRRIELDAPDAAQVRLGRPLPARGERAGCPGERALLMENGRAIALAELRAAARGPCWAIGRGMWS